MSGYGHKYELGIGFQNSFGTPVTDASSFEYVQWLEEDMGHNIPQLIDESVRGIHDEGDSYKGPRSSDGTLKINAKSIPLGLLLSTMFTRVTSEVVTGVYRHTFVPRTTDFDGLSANNPLTVIKYMDTNSQNILLYDLNASNLEMSVANGEFLTAMFGFVGGGWQDSGLAGSQTPTYAAGSRYKWNQNSVQIGGAANVDIMDMVITGEESLEGSHTLSGSEFPSRVKRTALRKYEVNGTLKFRDEALYNDFINQTEQALRVDYVGVSDISSGYNEELAVIVPAFRLSEFKPTGAIGQVEASFTGAAKYDASSANTIMFILQNTRASYPGN